MLPFLFGYEGGEIKRENGERNVPFKKETWCESMRERSAKEVKKKKLLVKVFTEGKN